MLPASPAIAPFAAPTAAVLAMSATVPPAAALIALSTTVLNIAVVPIIPSTAGPPAPATPIPIVITVIIKPLNAATSSSFSIDWAPFCILATTADAFLPAGSGNFATSTFNFSIGTALPTLDSIALSLGLPVIFANNGVN